MVRNDEMGLGNYIVYRVGRSSGGSPNSNGVSCLHEYNLLS